ncbi:MAG: HAD family hydrolase [Candidatus Limivivens sp.]|nr:HAD family hydrolase [Candidatus Limivivens sp.]
MIKLIASDLDGTLLLNGAQTLNPGTVELIHELTGQGRIFAAASGRQYANLQRLFAGVEKEIAYICENGALVMYRDEVVEKHTIDRETGQEILKAMMEREGAEALLSGVNTSYIQPKNPSYADHMKYVVKNNVTIVEDILKTEEPYLKISVYEKDGINNSEGYWKERFSDRVTVVTSGNAWLDTMPKGVHKGTAIKSLMKKLNVRPEEVLALGDNDNDIEMLEEVTFSFAMEKAKPGVKKVCRYGTACVEDTLREVLGGKYD